MPRIPYPKAVSIPSGNDVLDEDTAAAYRVRLRFIGFVLSQDLIVDKIPGLHPRTIGELRPMEKETDRLSGCYKITLALWRYRVYPCVGVGDGVNQAAFQADR